MSAIQLPYDTGSLNLWEYIDAMERGDVDFTQSINGRCPLCEGRGCIKQLTCYWRGAIDLFSGIEKSVPVARFECVDLRSQDGKRHTFSLLPLGLVPYHRYTAESMLMALLLFGTFCCEGGSTIEDIFLSAIPLDSTLCVSLLRFWAKVVVRGFRRAHAELSKTYNLSEISSGKGLRGIAEEVGRYLVGCSVRAPPEFDSVLGKWKQPAGECFAEMRSLIRAYSRPSGRFLCGRPSQERG